MADSKEPATTASSPPVASPKSAGSPKSPASPQAVSSPQAIPAIAESDTAALEVDHVGSNERAAL